MIKFIWLLCYGGNMKKFSNFLKSPVAFPLFAVGEIYLLWFLTGPMDIILGDDNFSNYFGGLILFGIVKYPIYIPMLSRQTQAF
jgi:hypothetical protein